MPSYPATKLDAEVGAMVRKFRSVKGMTLFELASQMGISTEKLSKLERGERRWGADDLISISRILDFSIDKIVGGSGWRRKKLKRSRIPLES